MRVEKSDYESRDWLVVTDCCVVSFTRRFLYQNRERQVGRRMMMTAEEIGTASLHEYYVSFRSIMNVNAIDGFYFDPTLSMSQIYCWIFRN